jgi:hypothetical protein
MPIAPGIGELLFGAHLAVTHDPLQTLQTSQERLVAHYNPDGVGIVLLVLEIPTG